MSVERLITILSRGDYEDYGEVVFDSGWEVDLKYEFNTVVLHVTETHLEEMGESELKPGYYKIIQSRTGSYYTDYEYGEPQVSEVEPYDEVVTVRKWRAK